MTLTYQAACKLQTMSFLAKEDAATTMFEDIKLKRRDCKTCLCDGLLIIPKEGFSEKDALNYKWKCKRDFYVRRYLQDERDASFEGGVTCRIGAKTYWICTDYAVKEHRLSPARNNVRASAMAQFDGTKIDDSTPTPTYNTETLLFFSAMSILEHLTQLDQSALKLLVKWTQRIDLLGFSNDSLCLALLYVTLRESNWLTDDMNEIQMFRAILGYLQSCKSPAQLVPPSTESLPAEYAGCWDSFDRVFPVTIAIGAINILYRMPRCNFDCLTAYARTSLQCLDRGDVDSVFSNAFDLCRDFDVSFKLSSVDTAVPRLIAEALSTRISAMHLTVDGTLALSLPDDPIVYSAVIRGPLHEQVNAAAIKRFRELWGEGRVDLRSFQDGVICHVVVFEEEKDRRLLIQAMVAYLLQRHFPNIKASTPILRLDVPMVAPLEPKQSFERLSRLLLGLQKLPLGIVQVLPTDPLLSATSIFPAPKLSELRVKEAFVPPLTPAISLVCKLESSSRWPTDLQAVRLLKQAIILELQRQLSAQYRLESSVCEDGFVDVLFEERVFRLLVHCDAEYALLQRQAKEARMDSMSLPEWVAMYRSSVQAPAHRAFVADAVARSVVAGPTIRFFKLWFQRQLLGSQMEEEVVELLVLNALTSFTRFTHSPVSLMSAIFVVLASLANVDSTFSGKYLESLPVKHFVLRQAIPDAAIQRVRKLAKAASRALRECVMVGADATELLLSTPAFAKDFSFMLQFAPIVVGAERNFRIEQCLREESVGSPAFLRALPGMNLRMAAVEAVQRNVPDTLVFANLIDTSSVGIVSSVDIKSILTDLGLFIE